MGRRVYADIIFVLLVAMERVSYRQGMLCCSARICPHIGLVYAIAKTAAYERDSQQLFEHLAEAMEPYWQRELTAAKEPASPAADSPV